MTEPTRPEERERLVAGAGELGLALEEPMVPRLLDHVALIRRWSGSYNLVARGDLGALVERHVLDSLCVHRWIRGDSVLDVGSGAGFPGLPLAAVHPGKAFSLLDSSGKRTRFLRHAVRTLALQNVEVIQARVEDHETGDRYGTIVSRAFSSLALFAERVRHLAAGDTQVIAIKGKLPSAELSRLPGWAVVQAVEPFNVPGLHAERHVVIMSLSSRRA